MKKIYKFIQGVVPALFIFFAIHPQKADAQYNYSLAIPAQNAKVEYDLSTLSYNDFYQNLAPYGQWIEDARYGYVWSPNVDDNFRPYYTNGNWAMTDYGNTWVSDYPWGWACFHYGRWTFNSFYGWLWIPGPNWGPAWVSWRNGNGYFGWAPLSPEYDFASKTDYTCPNDWWVFLPPQYIYSSSFYRFWSGPRNNKEVIHNSVFVNNTYENNYVTYVSGPRAKQVEDLSKHPVQLYKLSNSNNLNTKTHLDGIKMYRPSEIKPISGTNGQKAIPPNVMKAPKELAAPQAITGSQNATPEFRSNLSKSAPADAAGTHFPEPVKTAPQQGNTNNPYQWDVNNPGSQAEKK